MVVSKVEVVRVKPSNSAKENFKWLILRLLLIYFKGRQEETRRNVCKSVWEDEIWLAECRVSAPAERGFA